MIFRRHAPAAPVEPVAVAPSPAAAARGMATRGVARGNPVGGDTTRKVAEVSDALRGILDLLDATDRQLK